MAGGASGSIIVWETSSRDKIQHIRDGHRGPVTLCAFGYDGNTLYSASAGIKTADQTLRVWHTPTGELLHKSIGEVIGFELPGLRKLQKGGIRVPTRCLIRHSSMRLKIFEIVEVEETGRPMVHDKMDGA